MGMVNSLTVCSPFAVSVSGLLSLVFVVLVAFR